MAKLALLSLTLLCLVSTSTSFSTLSLPLSRSQLRQACQARRPSYVQSAPKPWTTARTTLLSQANKDAQAEAGGEAVQKTENKEGFVEGLVLMWKEMMDPHFDDDTGLAAMNVKWRIEIIENTKIMLESQDQERRDWAIKERARAVKELLPDFKMQRPGYMWVYWMSRWERMTASPRLRKALPGMLGVLNGAFILLFLRYMLPRILAMQTMGDLGEVGQALGLPPKEELGNYVRYAQGLDFSTKLLGFIGVFTLEKMFLIGEFIPIGVILPTISPVLFGGVAVGSVVTAFASTIASSANFLIGRRFLTEQVRKFALPNQPPIGESGWFQAINRRFDSSLFPDSKIPEGFKTMLLMRLAPLLPIPVDAHWYVAGTTPVKFSEFFLAHFLGTFKVAILDAYMGSLLLSAVTDAGAIADQTKTALVIETVAIIVISAVVTNIATSIFTGVLTEEGVDAAAFTGMNFRTDNNFEDSEDEEEDAKPSPANPSKPNSASTSAQGKEEVSPPRA